jgi:hypothetical protein
MHLVQVQEGLDEFRSRGATVVAVGQGTGEQAVDYCKRFGAEFPCVGDPERSGYRAFSLARGNYWTVVFRDMIRRPIESLRLVSQADASGARLAATDVLQLGGVAILDAGGLLRSLYVAENPQDMPSNAGILAELDRLAA